MKARAVSAILVLATAGGGWMRGGDSVAVPELERTHVWTVQGPDRFDASGLMRRDGVFFVVSDRHDDVVFRLERAGDGWRAVEHVRFAGPDPYPDRGYMDLEAIAPAPDGGFHLASEWGFAIVHVPAEGGAATWATPDLRPVGEAAGLFATRDAYIEGVTPFGPERLLVAIEREPRGLIEVMGGNPPRRVAAQQLETSRFPRVAARPLDFADLCVWRDRIFALARNQHLVVELRRDADGAWIEGEAWSYADTENAAEHRFTIMQFGQGEGLAMDDQFVYVLLDNNAAPRVGTLDDRRTWLFAFRQPLAGEPAKEP